MGLQEIRNLGRTEKKKNEIAKKMEKIIPVSAGEEIKRPLAREKNKQKLMSTWQLNERKKKQNVI